LIAALEAMRRPKSNFNRLALRGHHWGEWTMKS